jgi:hypothetical protein
MRLIPGACISAQNVGVELVYKADTSVKRVRMSKRMFVSIMLYHDGTIADMDAATVADTGADTATATDTDTDTDADTDRDADTDTDTDADADTDTDADTDAVVSCDYHFFTCCLARSSWCLKPSRGCYVC